MQETKYPILEGINSPADLKSLEKEKMLPLAEEIRAFLIENVTKTGGHLASNLGVVELSLAIHRVFDSPNDHIIFDVGHQSYIHKLVTGRREGFSQLRQAGGLSGFPKRSESEHDAFGVGHSSTSISAALGFATADKLSGSDARTVCVVGDGAFTGGMIHEALNNCKKDLKLTIILNENEMSISKNTGSFAEAIAKLRTKRSYIRVKKKTRLALQKIPVIGKPVFRFMNHIKKAVKDVLYGSNYFENMGIFYLGPVDGNDYETLEELLLEASTLEECAVIHVKTQKGKGYTPAEEEPSSFHGIQPEGKKIPESTFSHEFGCELTSLANEDKDICAITAAMSDGTGLEVFRAAHPERLFDVGIAEEHAVTFAAGLSANRKKPVVAIYSTFLQRAYDNIIHDVALQNLPVTFCIDRAGLNPSDGATHHGIFDVAFLSEIPGIEVYTPVSYEALRSVLKSSVESNKISAIRYPSGSENASVIKEFYPEGHGSSFDGIRTSGMDGAEAVIITHGKIAAEAIAARDILCELGVGVGIILCEKIKPYRELAEKVAAALPSSVKKIVTLEEEIRAGGFGMLLLEELRLFGALEGRETRILATDDSFCIPERGETCYEASGVCRHSVVKAVMKSK